MSKDGKIITDLNEVEIDTSEIFPDEYFTYLGKKFVKKIAHDDKRDENGNLMYKKEVMPDGHIVNGVNLPGKEWAEFYELEIIRRDSPDVIRQFGKPMTTQVIPHGPLTAKEVFKYNGEQIRYENWDLQDLVLEKRGDKIVRVSGTVKESMSSKELGYWK